MDEHRQRSFGLLAILAGVLALGLFWAVGAHDLEGYRLGVGSIGLPRARMVYFIAYWTFFGSAALLFIAVGVASVVDALWGWNGTFPETLEPPRDRLVVLLGAGAALVFPVLIRLFLLEGAPVTDDESAYRFMAELIASGRLAADSPPAGLKLFFDRFQMVNDGQRFAQYFVGWPALMAPGVWFGAESWMNALYAAIAVPALYGVARRLAGRWAAGAATLLYVTSPFLMAAAATLGAHTSCVAALAWTYWAFFRTRDEDAGRRHHALLAIAFSVAFFIRPLAALGMGLPLLASWAWDRATEEDAPRWDWIALFAGIAVAFAGLFFWVNYVQTGSPIEVAYQAFREYQRQNGGRFTGVPAEGSSAVPNLAISGLTRGAALLGNGLLRFDAALFGWPVSLLFCLLAGWRRDIRWVWLSAGGFLLTRFFLQDPGIDLFGPVHFAELALPAILLSAVGIRRATVFLADLDLGSAPFPFGSQSLWPAAGLMVAIALSLIGYVPARFRALGRVAENTGIPHSAVRRAQLGPAVVFAPRPFVPNCLGSNARHFVFWRPLNDPDLRSNVLWVNHVTAEHDRRFMRYAPERSGYILAWANECKPHLVPLQSERAERVPDGHIGGSGEGPNWSNAPEPGAYRLPPPGG